MKKFIAALALVPVLSAPLAARASEGAHLDNANIDLKDKTSLQNGAKYFTHYCMGCHSLKYLRYNRMAEDLGIDDATLRKDFLVGDTKPTDQMTNAMRPEDGEKWFGTQVPDLTLVARWRSPDWIYTYLKSFYVDPTRPWGVNNLVFPNVGMPNILGGLQGTQEVVMGEAHEGGKPEPEGVKLVKPGSMTPEQYDTMVRDVTAFLSYAGEPIQLERKRLGIYVMIFLAIFFVFAYAMKKEFWKDVH